jgi:hypothetical protein
VYNIKFKAGLVVVVDTGEGEVGNDARANAHEQQRGDADVCDGTEETESSNIAADAGVAECAQRVQGRA